MRRRFFALGYVSHLRQGVSERRPLAGSVGEVPASVGVLAVVADWEVRRVWLNLNANYR